MAPFPTLQRRPHSCGTAADNRHLLGYGAGGEHPLDLMLQSHDRVDITLYRIPAMAAVAPEAGNHILPSSLHELLAVVRVTEEGPGHRKQIRPPPLQIPVHLLRVLIASVGRRQNRDTCLLQGLGIPNGPGMPLHGVQPGGMGQVPIVGSKLEHIHQPLPLLGIAYKVLQGKASGHTLFSGNLGLD